ncbi:MAG: tetraacyldisaccharide 4'-kinase [Bacteroidales bacterium]|nr:tetraacyldisaccharide 4'-kinase [Bacteroidales bacterium]
MKNKMAYFQKVALFPLSFIYGIIVWIRNMLFDLNILPSKEYDIPIISVGNLTAGGTGKTPHVEYLINLLTKNFVVATLSRGYKRKTKGFFLVHENSTASQVGDEPLQIKRKYKEVAVAVDAKRTRGIEKLQKLIPNLQVIILDDAYQHRYVKPGISILLVNYNRNIFDDTLLPSGRLREPASARDRADIIIVTKCPENIKPIELRLLEKKLIQYAYQKVFFTRTIYQPLSSVFFPEKSVIPVEELASQTNEIIVVTGIANNDEMVLYLQRFFTTVHVFQFPDHYHYSARDLHEIIELFGEIAEKKKCFLITTEKDATKIADFSSLEDEIKNAFYYLPIQIEFMENKQELFDTYIYNYVHNNRPDNILHKKEEKKKSELPFLYFEKPKNLS